MNPNMNGAARRTKLSLSYGASHIRTVQPAASAGALSAHELKRIVAGMIG
jgi:hypothetical protein